MRVLKIAEFFTKKHSDIFFFQIANWLSSLLWYSFFLFCFGNRFGEIAGVEVSIGFLNTLCCKLSLDFHGKRPSKNNEYAIIGIKFFFAFIAFLFALSGILDYVYWIGLISYLSVPVHLNLLYGYNLISSLLFGLRFVGIVIIYISLYSINFSIVQISLVYFFPLVVYGMVSTLCVFDRLPNAPMNKNSVFSCNFFELGKSTVCCFAANQLQAEYVRSAIKLGEGFGLTERLLRSAFSFIYPYLVRCMILQRIGRRTITLFLASNALILSALGLGFHCFTVITPTFFDVYITLLSGKSLLLDVIVFFQYMITSAFFQI